MIDNISRHLKGIFVAHDVSDSTCRISRAQCLTLQHYQFDCERQLNEQGMPFGRTLPSTLSFTVRVIDNDDCRSFYKWLVDHQIHDFSIVFNASYDTLQYLSDWDAALVATGYMMEVDEQFSSWNGRQAENQQMTVKMKVLLSEIRFLGESGDKTIEIIH